MPEGTNTNWGGVAAGLAAVLQWLLFCYKPGEPWAYTPGIFVLGYAAWSWFSAANYLRRTATGLLAAGTTIGALPTFELDVHWLDFARVRFLPLDGATTVAIVCVAAGFLCIALEFHERVKSIAAALAALGLVAGVAIVSSASRSESGGAGSGTAPTVNLQHSTGNNIIAGNIEGDVNQQFTGPPPAQMDPPDLERPSYADIAPLLDELRRSEGWSAEKLHAELTGRSAIAAKDVNLSVDNLTDYSLRVTLIDCTTCFDDSALPKTVSSPLESSVMVGNEVCPTLLSFRAQPKLQEQKHSVQVPSSDFEQFCQPSGWFAAFADNEGPGGALRIVPLGIFQIFSGPEPVLELRSMEDIGNGRTIKAELLQ